MKNFFTILLSLIAFFSIITTMAFYQQNNILDKHGVEFNNERKKLGIYPLEDFQAIEKVNWDKLYTSYTYEKWKSIITNSSIESYVQYTFPKENNRPYHKRKEVFYMTHLLFWQNYYLGESDVFNYELDSNRTIELRIIYQTANNSQSEQFYSYIDTNYSYENPNFNGGRCEEDIKLSQKITKKEANIILKEWGLLE